MDTKVLTDSLDEKLFSDKYFKKVYLVLVFWLVLSPIIVVVFGCLGINFGIINQTMVIALLFGLVKFFELVFNWRKISFKEWSVTDYLIVGLLVWFILVSIVSKSFNVNFFYGICYFLCFALILNVDKKYFKLLAIILVFEIAFDSLLALFDLDMTKIPPVNPYGEDDLYAMSMQFLNPNWSAVVVIVAILLAIWIIYKCEKLWKKIVTFVAFLVLTFGLFVGGSYAPEFALFMAELALVVYLWVKNKKCSWWVFSCFLISIFISFLVWFFPDLSKHSTACANFFYESLAVIDGKLKTNLVEGISKLFNKLFGWEIIDSVAGSDGWTRGDLTADAFAAIFSSPKSFIFGYGAAYIYTIRVHNVYIAMWLEFGIVGILLFLSIIVMTIIKFSKAKKNDELIMVFVILCALLLDSFFCCIEPYSFIYLIMIFAAFYKMLKDNDLKLKKILEKNNEANKKIEDNLAQK